MRDIAVAVAHKLGIPCTQPVIISNGMNTVVHLRPSPIVARVPCVAHLIALAPVIGADIGQRTQQRLDWLEHHYG